MAYLSFSKKNMQSGFTLIEMLVAVLIFSLSLVALTTIASRGIGGNRAVANEISAQYLAAEGVEAVRSIRDSNYTSLNGWLSGMTQCLGESCYLELQSSAPHYTLNLCQNSPSPCENPLVLSSDNLIGATLSGTPTVFSRTIFLEQINPSQPNQIKVRSEVRWSQGRIERVIVLDEILFDWQNTF